MSLFRGIWFYTAGNQEFLFRFFDENFWLKKWMKRYWTLSGNQSETKKMFRWELCLHPVNHKMVKFTKNQEKRSISDMILPYFPVYLSKYIHYCKILTRWRCLTAADDQSNSTNKHFGLVNQLECEHKAPICNTLKMGFLTDS